MRPGYLDLYASGELARRAEALEKRLVSCDICPHECGIDRLQGETGFCRSGGLPIISSACAHHGEEPPLSGTRGSGTIFFANCNMRCVYCQNHQISQGTAGMAGIEMDCRQLAGKMVELQAAGCHNINLVSPTHFVPQIARALVEAVPLGLSVPLVYNTGGYDSLDIIKQLDGIVDIYLPDLRYASNEWAAKLSRAPGYVESARAAIKEMYRQVGNLELDSAGVARRGLIVRHLILPSGIAGSEDSLAWLAQELSPQVTVSIMSQYTPLHRAKDFPQLARRISPAEYRAVTRLVSELGLDNGWLQAMDSAESYLPDFEREGHPFEQ